jgi:8-oxo-dGTP pyrophosphatase MutT (NUDIX family)
MKRLQIFTSPPPTLPVDGQHAASVALIFWPDIQGNPELLMIQRAEREGDPWSGHMAFPGGHFESEDANLVQTAIRETAEEIGLELPTSSFLGVLSELQPVSRKHAVYVTPCLFQLSTTPEFFLSPEVAAVHAFPLARFMAMEGRSSFPYSWNGVVYDMPCINLDGTRIWGLSLRMIDELLERLAEAG